MSVVTAYSVHCDLPSAEHPHDHHGVSACTGWTENASEWFEARQLARAAGWLHTGGKDYCPAARKVIKA